MTGAYKTMLTVRRRYISRLLTVALLPLVSRYLSFMTLDCCVLHATITRTRQHREQVFMSMAHDELLRSWVLTVKSPDLWQWVFCFCACILRSSFSGGADSSLGTPWQPSANGLIRLCRYLAALSSGSIEDTDVQGVIVGNHVHTSHEHDFLIQYVILLT